MHSSHIASLTVYDPNLDHPDFNEEFFRKDSKIAAIEIRAYQENRTVETIKKENGIIGKHNYRDFYQRKNGKYLNRR